MHMILIAMAINEKNLSLVNIFVTSIKMQVDRYIY
jgi:hypothetical protein